MWGYRTCRVAGVRALRALRALVRPSHPHVGLLFRVWATPPMCGTGGPRAGQAARVRKKGYSPTPGSLQCAQARYVEPGPSRPHVGLLFRVWATPPMYGTGGPRAGHVGVQVVLSRCPWAAARPRDRHTRACGSACRLEARPGPAAAPGHRFCPRVPQPSLLLPSEPGGCCGGMRQAAAVFDRCGITK